MHQRLFPRAAGDLYGLPKRVLAPQRGRDSIGPANTRRYFTSRPDLFAERVDAALFSATQ